MVVVFAMYLHALIRLYLEVLTLCALHHRSLHLHGEVVAAVLVLAMGAMVANISKLRSLANNNLTTLVLDLILSLHGYRNLSLILRVMARILMLTRIRQPWMPARVMAE